MKMPIVNINPTKLQNTIKKIVPITILLLCIFLLGGGIDLLNALLNGKDTALIINPKLTGLSPAAMLMYGLGFTGLLFILWGAKDLRGNYEDKKIVNQSAKRLVAGIFLIGLCYFSLEVMLRIGYEALKF